MATATAEKSKQTVLPDINTKYVYILAQKSEHRGRVYDAITNEKLPDPEFTPRRNLILSCNIIWHGGTDPFDGTERKQGKYRLRYYDGCNTLFVDKQPQDKATIDELVQSTRQVTFLHGYAEVYGYDSMMKSYMDMCSWNGESPYRTPQAEAVFLPLDTEKQSENESDLLDMVELALDYAKKADAKKMRTHARFLGISFEDAVSGNTKSEAVLRTDYRKAAKDNPKKFVETYNDKSIHVKTWIEDSLNNGKISTTIIPNTAVWKDKGVQICDISGLKTAEGILNRIIEFSQTAEGSDFLEMITAANK